MLYQPHDCYSQILGVFRFDKQARSFVCDNFRHPANLRTNDRCASEPRLKKNIGFVNVPTDRSIIGTELAIDAAGGQRSARVVPIPFIEPKKKISR